MTTLPLHFRKATAMDRQHVKMLYDLCFAFRNSNGANQSMHSFLAKSIDKGLVIVAETGFGNIAAYLLCKIEGGFFADKAGHVLSLAVDPQLQGQGIGRRMMENAERTAFAENAVTMMLEVRASNLPAVGLYESLGYKTLARAEGFYADGAAALEMEKPLTGLAWKYAK